MLAIERDIVGSMLQFLITALDGTDEGAAARREGAKREHRLLGERLVSSGNILFSTAIINNDEDVIGSLRVMQFESQAQLDEWLENEPYVQQKVWQKIDIKRCKMGPMFEWMTLEPVMKLSSDNPSE